MEKQKIRLIHNMARSGSTLICKCLGCMKGVVLLSEIHPQGWEVFNPIKQAQEWFGLLSRGDIDGLLKINDLSFADVIGLIELRARQRGGNLVIRDWSHFDFTGYPFISTPGYRPLLYDELAESFDVIRIAVTRDPVAQWQSLANLAVMEKALLSGEFGVDRFLEGYRKYAELCTETGFIRYEDFVLKPEIEMRRLCSNLQIEFDPDFINNWPDYKTITGDIPDPANPDDIKRPRDSNEILSLPGRPVEPDLRNIFLANADYRRACELLGYDLLE